MGARSLPLPVPYQRRLVTNKFVTTWRLCSSEFIRYSVVTNKFVTTWRLCSSEFIRYVSVVTNKFVTTRTRGASSEFREAISVERGERPEMIAVPFAEDVDP